MMNLFFRGICLSIPFFGLSQHFKEVQIPKPDSATYSYAQVEPSIAINPLKPKEMIAGTVMDDYYYSTNGGRKWKSKTLRSKYGVNGDPVMHIDQKGRYYYFHLASPKTFGHHLDRIVCQSSSTIEGDFNQGSYTAPEGVKVQDKHWVTENSLNGELYLTWTQFDAYLSEKPGDSSHIMFAKSSDQGETWSAPKRISQRGGDCLDDDNTVEGAVPAVGPDGTIYVAWTGPNGLVFTKSTDGGETWLEKEIDVAQQVEGWTLTIPGIYRANGLPILRCNPKTGDLFLNWADQRNGTGDTDIWISKSSDSGETWSDPIKVNQDESKRHQFFTWLSIDPITGYLYVVYYDRRSTEGNATDVYLSVSKDNGDSFTDYKVSSSSFVPDDKVFFGDYTNIAVYDGVIRPVWSRMDEKEISLWVALISQKQLDKINK
ncbi:sialidase family protein [Lishizhenia sp.]|uniref:sialidase family protein n=1 Tax=Lishizhenia sp. TaxID=2497594 RepID=UPI00299E9B5E|nr:sialidase family protein [Lishizhenia sp.]MDX1446691.1 sialidase family protein [Lishizhenia sp.]